MMRRISRRSQFCVPLLLSHCVLSTACFIVQSANHAHSQGELAASYVALVRSHPTEWDSLIRPNSLLNMSTKRGDTRGEGGTILERSKGGVGRRRGKRERDGKTKKEKNPRVVFKYYKFKMRNGKNQSRRFSEAAILCMWRWHLTIGTVSFICTRDSSKVLKRLYQ